MALTKAKHRPSQTEHEVQQYAIAGFDLMWCERYLVAYIELMTPPASEAEDIWRSMKSRGFSDVKINFLDIHARALVTSIVMSYIRPWSDSKRADGSKACLSKTIFRDLAKVFRRDDEKRRLLPFHQAVHDRLLMERNKVVAHSDFPQWGFVISRAERDTVETKLKDPFHYLSLEDARQLLDNTRSLRSQLNSYERNASSKLGNTKP